jgi:hypothetical protein
MSNLAERTNVHGPRRAYSAIVRNGSKADIGSLPLSCNVGIGEAEGRLPRRPNTVTEQRL